MTGRDRPGTGTGHAGNPLGPQESGVWGWTGGIDKDPPWGVSQNSPMDEGSEPTAVTEGRRAERRAAEPGEAPERGVGSVEPTRVPAAGPGGPPDPAPSRRTFPDPSPIGDLPDNSIERQTGMHTRRIHRDDRHGRTDR